MPIIQVNGRKVHYQEMNKGAEQSVVMVHGMLGNLAVYYFRIAPFQIVQDNMEMFRQQRRYPEIINRQIAQHPVDHHHRLFSPLIHFLIMDLPAVYLDDWHSWIKIIMSLMVRPIS